jgi:hypothetical protein
VYGRDVRRLHDECDRHALLATPIRLLRNNSIFHLAQLVPPGDVVLQIVQRQTAMHILTVILSHNTDPTPLGLCQSAPNLVSFILKSFEAWPGSSLGSLITRSRSDHPQTLTVHSGSSTSATHTKKNVWKSNVCFGGLKCVSGMRKSSEEVSRMSRESKCFRNHRMR